MNLWDVMVSVFWFMMLVAWFWLVIAIIGDIFRDDELSGPGKAAWCVFVILLPWLGVFTYLIARGRSMGERRAREAMEHEQAFRRYVRDVAATDSGVADELTQLDDLRQRGVLTREEYERGKQRVLGPAEPAAADPTRQSRVADKLPS